MIVLLQILGELEIAGELANWTTRENWLCKEWEEPQELVSNIVFYFSHQFPTKIEISPATGQLE